MKRIVPCQCCKLDAVINLLYANRLCRRCDSIEQKAADDGYYDRPNVSEHYKAPFDNLYDQAYQIHHRILRK